MGWEQEAGLEVQRVEVVGEEAIEVPQHAVPAEPFPQCRLFGLIDSGMDDTELDGADVEHEVQEAVHAFASSDGDEEGVRAVPDVAAPADNGFESVVVTRRQCERILATSEIRP
jgi:hypothetical protein